MQIIPFGHIVVILLITPTFTKNEKKNLFWFLLCRSLSAAPTSAEQAAFQRHPQDSHNHHDQEANDIQRVVLNPVQIVCSYSEVWGPFVSHDKLSPESRQVHRWERTIQVNLRQFHHPLFETTGRYGNRGWNTIETSIQL